MSDSATATPEPPSRERDTSQIFLIHSSGTMISTRWTACSNGPALVRAAGVKDTGWDSYTESLALLTDLTHLMHIDLPNDKFLQPADTKARLGHVLEMDFPYELLAVIHTACCMSWDRTFRSSWKRYRRCLPIAAQGGATGSGVKLL
jgi:hypothetical protein